MNTRDLRPALVLLGCIIGIGINFAPIFASTFSAFVKPIAAEFGWSRIQVMSGYSIAMASLAVAAWPTGMLIDRFSPRRIALYGVPVFGIAVASMSLVPASYPIYLLACALLGISAAGCFHIVYISVLAGWFDRRFGLALGMAIGGAGLGSTLMPSFAQAIITSHDWRLAYIVLGLTSIAVAWPSAWLLLHERTQGKPTSSARRSEQIQLPGVSRADALRTPLLWRVTFCYFVIGALVGAHVINLIPLLTDRGVDVRTAAALAGLYGFSVMLSRIIGGYLLDRIDAGRLGTCIFALGTIGCWLLTFSSGSISTILAILLIGVMSGAESDVAVVVVKTRFGRRAFGTLNGIVYSSMLMGILSGPLWLSLSYDWYGSYLPGQYPLLVAGIVAGVIHFRVSGQTWRRVHINEPTPSQSGYAVDKND